MNIFKKLFRKLTKKEKKTESWYNNLAIRHDPSTGTPNGEAYISPDSIGIGLCRRK